MEQVRFPIIDAILCDAPSSGFDASGGRKSRGRSLLLKILETRTRESVAQDIRCTPEFVSLLASGKRKPARWQLMDRIASKLGIPRDSWALLGSPLAETISDRQLRIGEQKRYERWRITELEEVLEEHRARLIELDEEEAAMLCAH